MKFKNEKPSNKKNVSSCSKSRLALYEKCPLRAYKTLRETSRSVDNARMLDVGILAHEIAAKKVFAVAEKEYNLEEVSNRFPMDVIYEVQAAVTNAVDYEKLFRNQAIIGIEESFSFEIPELGKDFRLIAKPDALTYREVKNNYYMGVYEWKSGFAFNSEVDTEAIVYAYATYKKYGLPVMFTRLNIRTGKSWSHEFTIQALEDIEESLLKLIAKYKKDMESDITPEFKPGTHCQYCPYIAQCQGRKYVNTLRHKYKAALWAKELAKKYESEVKEAAKSVLSNGVPSELEGEGTSVLLPFLDNRYGAIAETSKSYQLATRKIKKDQILNLLLESGQLENVLDKLDIKFDEELSDMLVENYQVPMKEVVRTSIKLKEVKESEEN